MGGNYDGDTDLSMRMTSAPALLAARAADNPEGPPPTTNTWELMMKVEMTGDGDLQDDFVTPISLINISS